MKKHLLSLLLIFVSQLLISQTFISGRLFSNEGKPIPNATISLNDPSTDKILSYTISDSIGGFHMKLEVESPNLLIHIRSMGFSEIKQIIKNKSQSLHFQLRNQEIKLKEVLIKKPPIEVGGDTIRYNVQYFSRKVDRSILDVIKRLPGIQVYKDGTILYQGKPISNFYIEGLDLLDGRYNLATENLPHDKVANIEILENHQPLKILDSLVFSDQTALNLELKNDNSFTGNAEIGFGASPLLWKDNLTPMMFSKKSQALASYQTNNTGIPLKKKNYQLTAKSNGNKNSFKIPEGILSIEKLSFTGVPEKRWLFNQDYLLSANFLQKLNKSYKVRLNLSFVKSKKTENGITSTNFFEKNDTIILKENSGNIYNNKKLQTSITLEKNTKENYLNNTFRFNRDWDTQQGMISSNQEQVKQELYTKPFSLFNDFAFILPVRKHILHINSLSYFTRRYESLAINPGQFKELLNDGKEYDSIDQLVNLSTFKTSNSINCTKGLGLFTLLAKADFNLEIIDLNSHINRNAQEILNPEFRNKFKWIKNRTGGVLEIQFRKKNWQLNLNTPLYFNTNSMVYELDSNDHRSSILTFEPNFYLNYKLNNFWKFKTSFGINHFFGDLDRSYNSYILKNYRNISRYDTAVPERKIANYESVISYKNPINFVFGNVLYNYRLEKNNLLFENNIFRNGGIEIIARNIDNKKRSHSLTLNIEKYISPIKSKVRLTNQSNLSKSRIILNGENLEISSLFQNFEASIDFKLLDQFDIKYQFQYSISNNSFENNTYENIVQQSQVLEVNYEFLEKHHLNLNLANYLDHFKNNLNQYTFCDLNYHINFGNLEVNLAWSNIFNIQRYHNSTFFEYGIITRNYEIRPSNILLELKFSI